MSEVEKGNLLVVDDNEDNRDMLSRRLRRQGYSVVTAEDGRKALDLLDTGQKFDLVLLDIMMPGISGLEVLQTIRQRLSITDLPIIMATAKDNSEDIVGALQLGANDYVTKPLDFAVVMARVQTQLVIKRLSELKDDFLRIASHDLKNPLMVVLTSGKMLQKRLPVGTAMTPEMQEVISKLIRRSLEMQWLIEDFLDFQALQDGRLELTRTEINLNHLARQVIEDNQDYAKQKNVTLDAEFDNELPQVEADGVRLFQVINNMVSNAIKFGPPGTHAKVRTSKKDHSVCLEVIDSGPGLKPDDLNKVFRKYARLSNKPTGAEKSSGLGLAICKQLIDLHGGEIGVQNNPDRGATFWFRLPVPIASEASGPEIQQIQEGQQIL